MLSSLLLPILLCAFIIITNLQSLSSIVIVTLVGSLLCMSLLVKVTSAVSSPSKKLSSMTSKGMHISVGPPGINVSLSSSIIIKSDPALQ